MKNNTTLLQKISLILSGILLCILLLEAALRLCGFTLITLQGRANRAAVQQDGAYRILCLGESTTQGQWATFLEAALNQGGTRERFVVIDEGRAGTNTAAILSRVEAQLDRYRPDMVVAMMGINDSGAAHLPQDKPSASKAILLLRSLKIYKLARFLYHVSRKTNSWALAPAEAHSPNTPVSALNNERAASAPNQANIQPYIDLGRLYLKQGLRQRAEEQFEKAFRLSYGNVIADVANGVSFLKRGQFHLAEEQFNRAGRITSGADMICVARGIFYIKQAQFQLAAEQFDKALHINPGNDKAYAGLEFLYQRQGLSRPAHAPYYPEAARRYSEGYKELTAVNYRALKNILDKRKIRLVCAQYPLRAIAPLRNIFAESPNDIVFVDNKQIFEEALMKAGYRTYFIDMFGGNFGHCTPKGNKLLGENIARVILKEVFGK